MLILDTSLLSDIRIRSLFSQPVACLLIFLTVFFAEFLNLMGHLGFKAGGKGGAATFSGSAPVGQLIAVPGIRRQTMFLR